LQNRHGKGIEEGLNSNSELEVWKKDPQSGTQDELWVLRKYCSDLQKEKLSLAQENNALRTEKDDLRDDFDELKSKYSALVDNLNTIKEERFALRRGRDKLIYQEGSVKGVSEDQSSIQEDHLMLTQERDTLMSELEKLEVNFKELERECSTLKEDLDSVTEDRDALQKYKDKVVHLRDGMKIMLNELLGIERALLAVMQERDTLNSEHEELVDNFEELKRECNTLKDNLNVIREKCDALQKSKDLLIRTETRMKMMLDEESSIQNPQLIWTQERDTLRSQNEELKVSFYELVQEYFILKEDLKATRDERDTLKKGRVKLICLKCQMEKMLDELSGIQKAHLVVTQERDILRSGRKKLKVNIEELERERSALIANLSSVTKERDALQREKEKLVAQENREKRTLDEQLGIQRAHLIVNQERESLRSGREKLKVNIGDLQRDVTALIEKLNITTDYHDSIQKGKEILEGLESREKNMMDEQ
jgi:chromosome segregation ATPase